MNSKTTEFSEYFDGHENIVISDVNEKEDNTDDVSNVSFSFCNVVTIITWFALFIRAKINDLYIDSKGSRQRNIEHFSVLNDVFVLIRFRIGKNNVKMDREEQECASNQLSILELVHFLTPTIIQDVKLWHLAKMKTSQNGVLLIVPMMHLSEISLCLAI